MKHLYHFPHTGKMDKKGGSMKNEIKFLKERIARLEERIQYADEKIRSNRVSIYFIFFILTVFFFLMMELYYRDGEKAEVLKMLDSKDTTEQRYIPMDDKREQVKSGTQNH